MSTPNVTPQVPAPVTVNTPAADIAAANAASQTTPTPGQPRNTDGTFAAPPPVAPAAPPAQVAPTPENPVVTQDLGGGKIKVQYLTGETFEGTPTEVAVKMGQAHVSTKLWAKEQVAAAQTPQSPPTPAAPPSPFANPEEQQVAEYTANLQAKLLGYQDWRDMQRALGNIQENTIDYASQTTALQFQATQPDFNPTKDNSDKLLGVISQSGLDPVFETATREQQVMMLRQAHAYCLQQNIYQAKPTGTTPTVPTPPPPAPTGRSPQDAAGLPENLRATVNDTPEQIKAKWAEAVRLGYQ